MPAGTSQGTSARFSLLILAAVALWLLVQRPGQLANTGEFSSSIILNVIFSASILFLVAWANHGVVLGLAAIFLFVFSDPTPPESWIESFWQLNQVLFLACLGIHLYIWTELNNGQHSLSFWIVCALCVIGISSLLWIGEYRTSELLAQEPTDRWDIANQRLRNCSFAMLVGGGVLPFLFARFRRGEARTWAGICLVAPGAGYAIASLLEADTHGYLFYPARWGRLFADLSAWSGQPDLHSVVAGWCWASPTLVLPLMAIGLWRAGARGFKQRRKGILPVAWLVLLAAILLLAALLPASSEILKPTGLLWLSVALCVFAVGDLLLLLFEQLALPAPEG